MLGFKTQIHSDFLGEEVINLLDTTFQLPARGYSYNILDVSDEYTARPDLISMDAYGDGRYADIICKINGISNPFELNAGMKIIIPGPEYIDQFAVHPTYLDSEPDSDTIPVPKKVNQKRKANEAVVGDSRFHISAGSKIIVY